MSSDGVLARVIDPDGRIVEISDEAWRHACEHAELKGHFNAVKETITHPHHREPDVRPGRERFFGMNRGPTRWLRVVVSYEGDAERGVFVTAFGQRNDP